MRSVRGQLATGMFTTLGMVFLAIGLGMSLPYILLALEPSWMRFIPRPGPWMERFKQVMGFLLMATVLWLLWVLGKQMGVEGVIWTGAFLLCLALGCWLVGSFVDLGSSRRRRSIVWGTAAAGVAAAYLVLLDPVFRTEARIASASIGTRLRGSITSAEMPSAASVSAAASASCTSQASATMVTSPPSRFTSAWPSGTV